MIALAPQTFIGLRTSKTTAAAAIMVVIALAAQTVDATQFVASSGRNGTTSDRKHTIFAAALVHSVVVAGAFLL